MNVYQTAEHNCKEFVVVQGKLEDASKEVEALNRLVGAANEKVHHREKALACALTQLKKLQAELATYATSDTVSPRTLLSPSTAVSTSSSCSSQKGKKKGNNKGRTQGISNATTSRADAAKAADAAAAEHDSLEKLITEQADTILRLQEKVGASLAGKANSAGVCPLGCACTRSCIVLSSNLLVVHALVASQ